MKTAKLERCPICGIKRFTAKKGKPRKLAQMAWWNHVRECYRKADRGAEFAVSPRASSRKTPTSKGKFTCHKCGASFRTLSDIVSHTRQEHADSWARGNATQRVGVVCPECSGNYRNGYNLRRHMKDAHRTVPERVFTCHTCGLKTKTSKEANAHAWIHRKESKPNGATTCATCSATFNTPAQLRSHMWIHSTPKKGEEWGDKDRVRASLQEIAAVRLSRLPIDKRMAICLPGDRPEHEMVLMKTPGFTKVYMVECLANKAQAAQGKGFPVIHGDFIGVLTDLVNSGTHMALIDYDLCGMLSYAEGAALLNAIRLGGLADIAVIRVTCCRRSYKHPGEVDIEALDKDIAHALLPGYAITGKSWHLYVGKDRSAMSTQQWIIEKEV